MSNFLNLSAAFFILFKACSFLWTASSFKALIVLDLAAVLVVLKINQYAWIMIFLKRSKRSYKHFTELFILLEHLDFFKGIIHYWFGFHLYLVDFLFDQKYFFLVISYLCLVFSKLTKNLNLITIIWNL